VTSYPDIILEITVVNSRDSMHAFLPGCPLGRVRHQTIGTTTKSLRRPRACLPTAPNATDLIQRLSHPHQPTQTLALISLSGLPQEQALSALHTSKILQSPNPQVRLTALATLGKLGAAEETRTLVAAMCDDEDHSVRAAAASGLGSLLDARDGVLGDARDPYVSEAASALEKAATSDEHFIVRYAAIVSLGNVGDSGAVEMLLRVARDSSSPILEAAASVEALGEVVALEEAERDVLEVCEARARDRDDLVRAAVARTLGSLCERGVGCGSLQRMLEEEGRYGRSEMVLVVLNDVMKGLSD